MLATLFTLRSQSKGTVSVKKYAALIIYHSSIKTSINDNLINIDDLIMQDDLIMRVIFVL